MPSGGRRKGMPGKAYPQRSDLMAQPVRTAPDQPYGMAGQQAAAQKAIPLPQTPPVGAAPPMAMPAQPPSPPPVIGPNEPTQRPDEHVMTGVNRGPGLGSEAMVPPPVNMAPANDNADVLANLEALAAAHPNPGILALLASIKSGDYGRGGMFGKAIGQR